MSSVPVGVLLLCVSSVPAGVLLLCVSSVPAGGSAGYDAGDERVLLHPRAGPHRPLPTWLPTRGDRQENTVDAMLRNIK